MALGRVVEKGFLGDALALPALPGDLFHARTAAVQPVECKDPPDRHMLAMDQHRPHALRRD